MRAIRAIPLVLVLAVFLPGIGADVGLTGIADRFRAAIVAAPAGKPREKALRKLDHARASRSVAAEIKAVSRAGKIAERKLAGEAGLLDRLHEARLAYVDLLTAARDRLEVAAGGLTPGSGAEKAAKRLKKADKGLARAAETEADSKALRILSKVAKAVAEHIVIPGPEPSPVVVSAANYTGFLGGDGEIHGTGAGYTGHAPLLSGLPQQAYDLVRLPGFHFANDPRWLIPADDVENYGFADSPEGHVEVRIRSSAAVPGSSSFEQNDGWFRFKVRIDPAKDDEIRFELVLASEYGTNHWFAGSNASWDWEVFRPLFRTIPAGGSPGAWHRTEPPQVEGGRDSRTPRALFRIDLHDLPEHAGPDAYHVEVAQGLPYTLPDRDSFFLTRVAPPGVRVEKVPLGPGWTPAYGGLANLPASMREENEVYGVAVYKEPFATDVVLVTAGVHYEPPGLFVMEGLLTAVLESPSVLDDLSFVFLPAANPDGFAWGCAHVRPWGSGSGDLENGELWYEDGQDDPVVGPLRNYVDHIIQNEGATVVAHLDLHADLAPHPNRWSGAEKGEPPIYGYLSADTAAALDAADRFVSTLRQGPYSRPYTRPLDRWPSRSEAPGPGGRPAHFPLPAFHASRGIPVKIVLEYDETALYRAFGEAAPAPGLPGLPAGPPLLLREPDGPHGDEDRYWVDGFIDDPVVYREWGRELLPAVRDAFSN